MTFGAFISTRRKEAKLNLRDTEPAPVAQAFALGEVVSNTSAAEDNTNVES